MACKIFYYCVLLLYHFQSVTGTHKFSFIHEATEDQRHHYLLKITRVISRGSLRSPGLLTVNSVILPTPDCIDHLFLLLMRYIRESPKFLEFP